MTWKLSTDRPIYLQLVDHIRLQIVSGSYQPGSKIPSVRDLAEEASVNPNTMQRALSELERLELVYAQRTAGRFITGDTQRIASEREAMANAEVKAFFEQMAALGFSGEEALGLVKNLAKEITK